MEFKDTLKWLRKREGWKQTDAAKRIGISRSTYGAYEQGIRQPDFDTLSTIAKVYGVTTDYLLGLSDDPATPKHVEAGVSDEDYRRLSPTQRQILDFFLNSETLAFHERPEDLIEALPALEAAYRAIMEHKKRQEEKG